MNYSELTDNIQDITENTYTAAQLALFTRQAEKFLYESVQIPALRKNQLGTVSQNNSYLSLPSDFLYLYSVSAVDSSGNTNFLLFKDVNFIREAYPNATSVGFPKHYGIFDTDSLILGPTPDSDYSVEVHYGYRPESIVTAGTSWVGDNFDNALLNTCLVEAARFMKSDPDTMGTYQQMRDQAVLMLKSLGDGKLRQDTYRFGETVASVI